jgi:hypothetical protein
MSAQSQIVDEGVTDEARTTSDGNSHGREFFVLR